MTSFLAIKLTLHPISFLITTSFDARESATWFGVFHQVLHFPILAPSRCCLFRLPSFARRNLFWTPRPSAPNPLPITFRVTHPERLWAIIKTVREIQKYLDFCICWIKLGFYKIIFSLTSWFHQSSICNEKYAFLALLFHFWRCRKNKKTQLTKKNIHCSVLTSLRDIS